jgi:hypothetical protein
MAFRAGRSGASWSPFAGQMKRAAGGGPFWVLWLYFHSIKLGGNEMHGWDFVPSEEAKNGTIVYRNPFVARSTFSGPYFRINLFIKSGSNPVT